MNSGAIFDRRSIRRFKSTEVSRKKIEEIIYAGMAAPSAKNRQPWKCIVDLMKRDSEIKILISCTEEEIEIINRFHNESEYMKGILIRR